MSMKSILQNGAIAIFCTALAFGLFKYFEKPQQVIVERRAPVKLVSGNSTLNQTHAVRSSGVTSSSNLPDDFVEASKLVIPSAVNITSNVALGFRAGSGSGVIISEDGYIITNNHVVEDSENLEILLNDRRTFAAEIIGVDRSTDLAVIKINAKNLSPIHFGNSEEVQIGEWVLAVGNPFGLNSTVTAGIVSSKARNLNILRGEYAIESFIQTDAVVNPGNSGGALVNTDGDLIGINTAILTNSGNYEGYSFAIPSNLVRKVVEDLIEFGEVKRAVLGVSIRDINDKTAEQLGLPSISGVFIRQIGKNSSAAQAGLEPGDVITHINGIQINSVPELQEQIALYRPGEKVEVDYYRDGQLKTVRDVILKSIGQTFSDEDWQ